MNEIRVTFTKLPGRSESFVLEQGDNISKLLEIAGVKLDPTSTVEIKVNGELTNQGRLLQNGDDVIVSQKTKGA